MAHTNFETPSFPAVAGPATLQLAAFQAAAPIVLALNECDEELRAEAVDLFEQLGSGELDAEQRIATTALLAEILFPNADRRGTPGLDLAEAEAIAPSADPDAKDV